VRSHEASGNDYGSFGKKSKTPVRAKLCPKERRMERKCVLCGKEVREEDYCHTCGRYMCNECAEYKTGFYDEPICWWCQCDEFAELEMRDVV
jgi:hypothetical protein